MFEDNKGVFRSRKSTKDEKHNSQKNRTSIHLYNALHKRNPDYNRTGFVKIVNISVE